MNIVGIRQMSLLVVVHLLRRCRPSWSPGKKTKIMVFQTLVNREENGNYGVLGYLVCALIIFARVQQSDPWSYLSFIVLSDRDREEVSTNRYNMVPLNPMCLLCDIWHIKVRLFWRTDYEPICVKDLGIDQYQYIPNWYFYGQTKLIISFWSFDLQWWDFFNIK